MTATAGLRVERAHDERTGETFPVWVLYPSEATEQEVALGRYTASAAPDAPLLDGAFPLVIVSHGTGSSPFLHRVLAAHLARSGFVVALPEHPRNNRDRNDLAGTDTILRNRPSHVRAVVDHLSAAPDLRAHLRPDRVGVVGHSLGAYTALAVAGGRPTAFGHETPDGQPRAVPVLPDERVRALVLLAPATPWFMAAGALAGVRAPILMFSGAQDEHAPAWHPQIVLDGVPDPRRVEHRAVADAGHFSFLSPFPPALVGPALPPSQDPPGFDRQAFHTVLVRDVQRFLQAHLPAGQER